MSREERVQRLACELTELSQKWNLIDLVSDCRLQPAAAIVHRKSEE